MSAFESPLETWNTRYAGADYLFGRGPNAFLARQVPRLAKGMTALCVADGEGRNGVHLAKHGLAVTSFDFSENAVKKARALARDEGVALDASVSDVEGFDWHARRYDVVVAVFIQFMAPPERARIFRTMRDAVRPGGLMLVEGYRPEQVALGTGGPGKVDHMYTREWLEAEYAGWEILLLESYDAELEEGTRHRGTSALIDLVARKPAA